MDAKVYPDLIEFSGYLDEGTRLDNLVKCVEEFRKNNSGPIFVDFSKVTRSNSTGIVVLLKMIQETNGTFVYVNCPIWMVSQFNMIKGFFINKSYVRSVQLPFYSPENNSTKILTMEIGTTIPILKDYSQFTVENVSMDGKEFEADVDSEQYFNFISDNYENFSS